MYRPFEERNTTPNYAAPTTRQEHGLTQQPLDAFCDSGKGGIAA